jgi:glutamate racemase
MIGVFDSGLGGLSVLRALLEQAPDADTLYLADQAFVPYGPRSLSDVRTLTTRCVRHLIVAGCNPVVIACNTASGAALDAVRVQFPETLFVGTEPAVRPAALQTQSGVIAVLATQTTFASTRYASLIQRFAVGARVIEAVCPDWVMLVENLRRDEVPDAALIDLHVRPALAAGADALVLGCTHFPFLQDAIQAAIERWRGDTGCARQVAVIDPAPAIARQALRLREGLTADAWAGRRRFLTTGDARRFTRRASLLLPFPLQSRHIRLP